MGKLITDVRLYDVLKYSRNYSYKSQTDYAIIEFERPEIEVGELLRVVVEEIISKGG